MRSDCRTRASSVKCQVDAICFVQSGILSFVPIDWLLFSRDGCQVVFSYWIFARMRIIQFQFLSTLHLTLYSINKKHLRSTCYADVMQMLPFPSRLYTLHSTPYTAPPAPTSKPYTVGALRRPLNSAASARLSVFTSHLIALILLAV